MDVESALNPQPRVQTHNELCAIDLHVLRRPDCTLIPPLGRSEWRDRNAKTEGRTEGEIELRGTIAAEEGGLHMGTAGTDGVFVSATRWRKCLGRLRFTRAWFAHVRLATLHGPA